MMTVWNFVVTQPDFGEKLVPTPNGPEPDTAIGPHGAWVHEQDLAYVLDLAFPCGGVMKKGFMVGCPDAKQLAARPPEPPIEPPPAFFEVTDEPISEEDEEALEDFFKAFEPPKPTKKRKSRRK
jgi:hypothetical protein